MSKNPDFFINEQGEPGGLCDEMDGRRNTDAIISNVTVDWSGTTINNSYYTGAYPAACCCRRFTSDGINAGDVYLPAAGELIYIIPRNT